MRLFFDLTKSGIVVFVLVTGAAGYAMSHPFQTPWELSHVLATLAALYFLSAGSFAINQAQEAKIDAQMPRTKLRPIPSGRITSGQAWTLGIGFVVIGSFAAILVNPTVLWLGLGTVFLYNVPYTLWWKKKWAFGAVPGALPGATPVLIGYAANDPNIFMPEPVYLFLLMFLWQMPHFWSLAIRFKSDYEKGGIPVLPARIGTERTLYHMALYLFAYIATAAAAPYFTSARWAYAILVLPLSGIVLWQFLKYFKSVYNRETKSRWLAFFLWTNLSILVFLAAPVVDRWLQYAVTMAEVAASQEEG
ncbi:MAG: protoheme IX farnesyltransferase [Bdellovibrionales bacterium]|nr:protoheme IX farnesyltransferase [Bdellovibrionales bacterium]